MAKIYSIKEVRLLLKAHTSVCGQRDWAERNGVSPGYVNDVLRGRKEPGEKMLRALKLRRTVAYEFQERETA